MTDIPDRGFEKIYFINGVRRFVRAYKTIVPEDPMRSLIKAYAYSRKRNVGLSLKPIDKAWKDALIKLKIIP